MVPEIWSTTGRIFCHSGPPVDPENQTFGKMNNTPEVIIILQMCTINDSHDVWFLRYKMQHTKFLVILDHFLPFHLPNNLKNQNFEKLKKMPGDIIILHKCAINDNHMYSSCNMKCDRQNFLSFWTVFCHFTHLTTQKIKILKNWKRKGWRHYHFTHVHHKWQSNDVWFLRYWARQTDFFVILDHFLPFYPPNKTKYQNFKKFFKMPGNIIILQISTINYNHMMYGSWNIEHDTEFFVILDNFLPIYPVKTWKFKILKNERKPWRYYHFTQVYQKSGSYAKLFLRYGTWWM